MRFIPRSTKVKLQFYKHITLPDIMLGLAATILIAAIISSDLAFKFGLAIGVFIIFAPLFLTLENERVYMHLLYILRFLIDPKEFSKQLNACPINSVIPQLKTEDNLICGMDNSYTGVIEISQLNFDFFSCDKQDYLIDGVLTNALNALSSGQEADIIKLDKQLDLDTQLNAELERMQALIKDEESGFLSKQEYVSRMDILENRISVIDALNSDKPVYYSSYHIAVRDNNPATLKSTLSYIHRLLNSGNIGCHILENSELQGFLNLSFGKDIKDYQSIKNLKFSLNTAYQDDKKLSHFVVYGYPLNVPNAWGKDIFNIPNTKVVMKLKPVDKDKAIRRIDNAIMELSTQKQSKASKIIDNSTHSETLANLLTFIQNDNEVLFDTTLIITAYDEHEKSNVKKTVRSKLKENGLSANEMYGWQIFAYLSSSAFARNSTGISQGIHSSSVAACFPFSSSLILDKNGIFLGENELPVFMDFFKRDTEHVNGNMVIIGKSGSGKSYAAKNLLANFAADGAKIFILDPEREYVTLCKNLGGQVIDLSSSEYGKINPFQIMSMPDGCLSESSNSYYSHLVFLEEFYKVSMPGLSADCLEVLNSLTIELYIKKKIFETSDFETLPPAVYPVFDDLANLIDLHLKNTSGEYNKNCLETLASYISKFKTGGRYSELWNGPTDLNLQANFVCFDFQKMFINKNNTLANSQMLLLMKFIDNEIIKNRKHNEVTGSKRKIIVAIDEAHIFVDDKYPIALDFMFQLAKRIRKYDGIEIVITQSLKDFNGTQETKRKTMAIINASQYSMIFSLSPNDMSDLCELYEKAGKINEAECETIVHNPRGCAFLISSPEKRTNIKIIATPFIEKLFSVSETKGD